MGISPPFVISNLKFSLKIGSSVKSLTSSALWPLKSSHRMAKRSWEFKAYFLVTPDEGKMIFFKYTRVSSLLELAVLDTTMYTNPLVG